MVISTYFNFGPKVPLEPCENFTGCAQKAPLARNCSIKDVPSNAVGSTGCGLKFGVALDGLIMFYDFNAKTRS